MRQLVDETHFAVQGVSMLHRRCVQHVTQLVTCVEHVTQLGLCTWDRRGHCACDTPRCWHRLCLDIDFERWLWYSLCDDVDVHCAITLTLKDTHRPWHWLCDSDSAICTTDLHQRCAPRDQGENQCHIDCVINVKVVLSEADHTVTKTLILSSLVKQITQWHWFCRP